MTIRMFSDLVLDFICKSENVRFVLTKLQTFGTVSVADKTEQVRFV